MYTPAADRYDTMPMRRAGNSGIMLPLVSLGLWHNFGHDSPLKAQSDIVTRAFDKGITHFDLANNYGPPKGSAEKNFGEILRTDLAGLRDELIVTTKAGYDMWPGPYGQYGSRKYLLASLDQSLNRLGLEYVDIFYSHRFDPETPLRETLGALKTAVDSGRALYAGISSYSAQRTAEAFEVAHEIGLDILVHQPSYSMLNRWIEEPTYQGKSLLDVLGEAGVGNVVFSPLAQGMLTDKYLSGIPSDSRAATASSLRQSYLSEENLDNIRQLNAIAANRGQTLAQMAVAWVLRDERVTTALVGASSPAQLSDTLGALSNLDFSREELAAIDEFAHDGGINLWGTRSSDL